MDVGVHSYIYVIDLCYFWSDDGLEDEVVEKRIMGLS